MLKDMEDAVKERDKCHKCMLTDMEEISNKFERAASTAENERDMLKCEVDNLKDELMRKLRDKDFVISCLEDRLQLVDARVRKLTDRLEARDRKYTDNSDAKDDQENFIVSFVNRYTWRVPAAMLAILVLLECIIDMAWASVRYP